MLSSRQAKERSIILDLAASDLGRASERIFTIMPVTAKTLTAQRKKLIAKSQELYLAAENDQPVRISKK
jgi:hypothetical protein